MEGSNTPTHQDSQSSQQTLQPSTGHGLRHDDPENPQSWSLSSKIYTSLVAWCFTFALLYATTSLSIGIPQVAMEFGVSTSKAIVPFGVFFFGIALAPLYTPHLSERFGRNPVYFVACFVMALFLIGASRSSSYSGLVATRFFAGLFGGPIVVNVEGMGACIHNSEQC